MPERIEEFARIVSHDLRNPLNVADGRVELLGEKHDSEHPCGFQQRHRCVHESILCSASIISCAVLVFNGHDEVFVNRSDWVNKYIVAAVLLQFVGYAALSALIPHSDFATIVEPLHRLPTVLLVPVALIAVPAVVIAIALGALLTAVGLQPTNTLVLVGAYLVSVAGLWGYRRIAN